MKKCENCRFLNTGFHGEGICDFFGDDCPNWADNYHDGCLLKCQEVKKLINLRDDVYYSQFDYPRDINGERDEEDNQKIEKIHKDYDIYLKKVMERCLKRSSKWKLK